jgi:hypothetical protein
MEVRFKTEDEFMDKLAKTLGLKSASEVTREALTLLNWAANEVKNDRVILSSSPDGKDVHRLVMGNWAVANKK